ncbi:carboxypeptidase-like regulatory domain-containing protein [Sungkyunkwania multivorans]|uniref:Carboxypeptidase-like regulatory domain-containing protein n=1 Tax=Sungkyunkwania multivorans TaxID=1173618 RepID=A0ABW3CXZ3_9FLAO
MKNNYFLLFLLFPFLVNAQFFKELRGKVLHNRNSIVGIHVLNTTTGATTITDEEGFFEIGVRLNDTLFFSAVQYNHQTLVISAEILQQKVVNIYLEERITELEEVVVRPHNLEGDLTKDIKNSGVKPAINFDDVGIPGYKGVRQEPIISTWQAFNYGIPLGSINIEAIYKNWSGYYEGLKKRRKWDAENEAIVQIISFYGVKFFIETYALNEDEVYPFVLGCVADSDVEVDFKNGNHNLVVQLFDQRHRENRDRE